MRLFVGALWLLRFLPLAILAPVGRGFGLALFFLAGSRRRVVLRNLELCFPDLDSARRTALAREHFKLLGRSFLERGILWWSGEQRIRRLARVEGMENLPRNKPAILLVPHFVALDVGWTRLTLERDMAGIYANQSNGFFNRILYRKRIRFGVQLALSRQDGVREGVKAIRGGRPFYYLPDMDYGARDSIFVPFFGVDAATITGLSRLAKVTGAVVIPCIARMLPGGRGYVITVGTPWADFPGTSVEADTRRMNEFIEQQVCTMPAQYYWVHKRFKTRPPGEPSLYARRKGGGH